MENKEINVLDYFFILYNSWKFFLINLVVVCILAAGASMILPKYYKSVAVMLPPSESSEGFGFSQALSMMPVNIRLGSQGSPSDISMGVMKSANVSDAIIDRFNLIEQYGAVDRDGARLSLKSLTSIALTKEGMIQIAVEDRDPEQAAAIANMYCSLLDSLNRVISQEAAAERGDFLKVQIDKNSEALDEAENDLTAYQMKTNALSPFQQQRIAISVSSELEMEIMRKESLLKEYKAKSFSDTHPLVKDLLSSINILEEQLDDMRYGVSEDERQSLFMPLEDTQVLTLEYSRLVSRVDTLNQLRLLLEQQYEESQIQKVNPTSTVNVLDAATPPLHKSRPKRKLIVIIAAAASLFFSIIAIVIIEFFNRVTEMNPENREKIRRIARFLRVNS
ncbi:GumC family protein [Candidatus Latescibacterota bacterium]